jgi:hypothetical protein
VLDKISNFHRQFGYYSLKKNCFRVKEKGRALKIGFVLHKPNPDNPEPKIFTTKALRHKGFYFFILS